MFFLKKNQVDRETPETELFEGVGGLLFWNDLCLHAELHRFSLSALRSSDPDVVAHFQHEREINGDLGLQVTWSLHLTTCARNLDGLNWQKNNRRVIFN